MEELSVTIKELSDTLVDISVNVYSEPSANEMSSVSKLATTTQGLPSTVLQMSTTKSEISVTQAIQHLNLLSLYLHQKPLIGLDLN